MVKGRVRPDVDDAKAVVEESDIKDGGSFLIKPPTMYWANSPDQRLVSPRDVTFLPEIMHGIIRRNPFHDQL